jgi:hypothetical protein
MMKRRLLCVALCGLTLRVMAETKTFEADVPGQPPAGWTCGATGRGTPRWSIESDRSAPSRGKVLRQSGAATFPWCVRTDAQLVDGWVEVKFKPISGKEDQAGGVVWRWQDGDNYYVARANALENNVSLYHTARGVRKTLKYVDAPVSSGQRHTLRVEFAGTRIGVSLDGKRYIDLDDSHITGSGAVGVWTKADSVTAFDDFGFGGGTR